MKSRYITPVVTIFDEQGRIDPEQNTQIYDFIKTVALCRHTEFCFAQPLSQ